MQRFFHGSDHPPVVAWYRFLKSLRAQDITPVCIFDGPNRLPQKDRELARRQAARGLLFERAAFEAGRSNRVDVFTATIPLVAALPDTDRQTIAPHLSRMFTADKPSQVENTDTLSIAARELLASLEESIDQDRPSFERSFAPSKPQTNLSNIEENLYKATAQLLSVPTDGQSADRERIDEIQQSMRQLQLDTATLASRYAHRSRTVTPADYEQVHDVINAMGIPLIVVSAETPHEAEALGAVIVNAGYADAVVSEDSDVLLYDSVLLKNAVGRKQATARLNGKDIRTALGLDREQFIDLGLLCGSDFAETIYKLGPITALKLIQAHGSIEAVLQEDAASAKPKWNVPDLDLYFKQISLAREVFLDPPPLPINPSELQMKPAAADLDAVLDRYSLKDEYLSDGAWLGEGEETYLKD